MKLLIAGGRDFEDWRRFCNVMSDWVQEHGLPDEVVNGKCPTGADAFGEKWAIRNNLPVKEFPADWKQWGKLAGPFRNSQMADCCDAAICFWDGRSRGTSNMIRLLRRRKKEPTIILY